MKKTFGIICGGVFILLVLSGLSFAGMCGDHKGGEMMMGGSSSRMDQTSGNQGGDHSHDTHQQGQTQTMGQNIQGHDHGTHNEIMGRMRTDPEFMNQMMDQMMANRKIRDLLFERMMKDQEMRGRMMQQAASTH